MRTLATDRQRLALAAMIALTFVTGVVDAVGYLGLDRVFTGNMTGNIVILGMGVAGSDELPVLGPSVALAAFTLAAFAAGLYLRRPPHGPQGWHDRITALLSLGATVLVALTVVAAVAGNDDVAPVLGVVMAAATAAVMGQQAVVARALAIPDMTTVVVTSTLTALAGETWVRGPSGSLANRRAGAIVMIFLGAVTGALTLRIHMAVPYGVAAALTVSVIVVGHRHLHTDRLSG
ncbi:YoaK family protein [Mycolicibacterium sp. CH28]|uniref:YoaK family protein n=1 Tax=Mycolicibacterium sp. CH28 TaxID=2512237 RepID=UPI001F416A66|nr:YoaK family protein [Mycolicibacterium sp. CH28]